MLTFVLMGVPVAVSAAIQTARLNSAVTNLGVQNELDVIAAAVIGDTSFSGGIGTVPGAVLGGRHHAVAPFGDGAPEHRLPPSQDVVVGVVLVGAVAVDAALRSGRRRAAVAALVAGLIAAAVVIQTGQP
jgi:D-xylose transport system permease protein